MEFAAPEIAGQAIPGQFVMIGLGLPGEPGLFLPRPMSIAQAEGERLGLLIRIFGAGSRRLTALEVGERALLLGPLGSFFDLGSATRVLCVAGGVGLAPFLFLPRWAERHAPGNRVHLVYGERTASAVFDPGRIRQLAGVEPEIWTEDGAMGRMGRVTDRLDVARVDLVLGCGPVPMLKTLQAQIAGTGVPAQFSVEERMGCGVGTCVGCVVAVEDGGRGWRYERICVEGPVFSAERLRWSI